MHNTVSGSHDQQAAMFLRSAESNAIAQHKEVHTSQCCIEEILLDVKLTVDCNTTLNKILVINFGLRVLQVTQVVRSCAHGNAVLYSHSERTNTYTASRKANPAVVPM